MNSDLKEADSGSNEMELTLLTAAESDKKKEADVTDIDSTSSGDVLKLSYEEAVHRYHGRYQIIIFSKFCIRGCWH